MNVFVCTLAVSATLFSAFAANAGVFGKKIGKKLADAERVEQALSIGHDELRSAFDGEAKLSYGKAIARDMELINKDSEKVRKIVTKKKWSKAESHQALVAAWGYLRAKMDDAGESDKTIDMEKFFNVLNDLEYVEIKSTPSGARIKAGSTEWDETDDDGYLPVGKVTIRIAKDGYESIATDETVREGRKNSFSYGLKKDK